MAQSLPPSAPLQPLPVGGTVVTSFALVFGNLGALYRAALFPFVLSLGLSVFSLLLPPDSPFNLFMLLLGLFPYAVFGVAWHRFMLLGPGAAPRVYPGLQQRQLDFYVRFLAWIMGGVLAAAFAGAACSLPVVPLVGLLGGGQTAAALLGGLGGMVIAGYLLMRFAFVFPAVSVDETYRFMDSWRNTSGQGLRLLAAWMLVNLPIVLLLLLVTWLLLGQMPLAVPIEGLPEGVAPASPEPPGAVAALLLYIVSAALGYLSSALSLTVLSLAFRTCTGWVPAAPPGPPAMGDGEDANVSGS